MLFLYNAEGRSSVKCYWKTCRLQYSWNTLCSGPSAKIITLTFRNKYQTIWHAGVCITWTLGGKNIMKKNSKRENIFQWTNIRTFTEAVSVPEAYTLIFKCFPLISSFSSSNYICAIRSRLTPHPSADSIRYNTLTLSHISTTTKDIIYL